jgi:hypothetical protein
MTIAAAAAAVASVGAAIVASVVTVVALTGLAIYGVYTAAKGGYQRWKKVTDDPLSTREEIGSAAGEGVGDIAAEFIPVKLPKPLARVLKKTANRLRKVDALPGGRQLDELGPGSRERGGAGKADDLDGSGSGAGKGADVDEANNWSKVMPEDLDELGPTASKVDDLDELDELGPGAGRTDAAPAPAPKAADDGPLSDLVGKDVAPDELARRTGIAKKDFAEFDRYANDRGLHMAVRPASVAAPGQLARGAIPKDMLIKAKSVGTFDVDYLGATAGTEGLAAVFKPKMPPPRTMSKIRDTNPKLAEEITAGYKTRKAAYESRDADWAEYTSGADGKPPILQIDPDTGVLRGLDPASGKYKDFVSDYDLYDLRMKDGSPLTPEMYALVVADLQHMGLAQHGAHMNMKIDLGAAKFEDPATQAIFERIRGSHQPGPKGEPLVVFGDGAPRADWPLPEAPQIPEGAVPQGKRGPGSAPEEPTRIAD